MDIHYIVEALHQTGLFPDFDGFINFILFMIIVGGFMVIVLGSKKYRHLLDKIMDSDYF
jgi:hypothetical protein